LPPNFEAVRPPTEDPDALYQYMSKMIDFIHPEIDPPGDPFPGWFYPAPTIILPPGYNMLDPLAPAPGALAQNIKNRPNLPIAIIGPWEPWGETITSNRPWTNHPGTGSTVQIITAPSSNFKLKMIQTYIDGNSQSSLRVVTDFSAATMRITGSLARSFGHINDCAYISIASAEGNASLYFAAGPGNEYWMWPPAYLLGTSVLDGRDIDLSLYGIGGTITQVQLNININGGTSSSATMIIDEIDFLQTEA